MNPTIGSFSASPAHGVRVERRPTGIIGFDDMIEGGFPAGRTILVIGGPGTGKTVFCIQFLVNGITKHGEKGLYVSMEETRSHLYREMRRFGWDLEKHEREGNLAFVDAMPSFGRGPVSYRSLEQVLRESLRAIKELNVQRIAVDGIASLVFEFPNVLDQRRAMLRLANTLADTGATIILNNGLFTFGSGRPVQLEEYLTDGTVVLQMVSSGSSSVRVLQIEKMRETEIDFQPRPYKITSSGIEVLSRQSIK